MILIPALYVIFVIHYSVNVPSEDDWTVVPLIHAALHGHLTLAALWSLHDENRMLFPNLGFVALGVLSRDDLDLLTLVSAAMFVVTFFVFLAIFRSYWKRPLTPFVTLILGLVWFSIEDWSNALWGFQLAWYLILLCFVGMLYLLLVHTSRVAFTFALAASVIASFSFLHGLFLWPVGEICIAWMLPTRPRYWIRSKRALLWLGAAVCTTVIALWGYKFKPLGCNVGGRFQFNCTSSVSTFALHHPARTAAFVLIEIGNVIPNSNDNILWLSGVLGVVLLAMAVFVVVQSVRNRHDRNCLPVALIVFGLLVDLASAVARVQFLTSGAPSSTYTMPNLLILLALITYACAHFQPGRIRRRSLRILVVSTSVVFLLAQVSFSTHAGIVNARAWDRHLSIGARLVVNLKEAPAKLKSCYEIDGVLGYLLFAPVGIGYIGYGEDREDHLNVYSSGQFQKYRAEGLPRIPQCATNQ